MDLVGTSVLFLSLTTILQFVVGQQEGEVRLSGTNFNASQGRVEIYHDGVWGTICDDRFDNNAAAVICRMLGYNNGGQAKDKAFFGEGTNMKMWMDEVICQGSEGNINRCEFSGWGITDCNHQEDVGVICAVNGETVTQQPQITTTKAPIVIQPDNCKGIPQNLPVRLRGPQDKDGMGIVEVRNQQNEWGAVCDDLWGINNARVVCNMLCYDPTKAKAGAPVTAVNSSSSTIPIKLDDVQCTGTETSIFDCTTTAWGTHNCNEGTEKAMVTCVDLSDKAKEAPIPILECTDGKMKATFSKSNDPDLEEKHLTVVGQVASCGWSTSSFGILISISIPFSKCGTNTTLNATHIIYSNKVNYTYTRTEANNIVRVNRYTVELSCEFPREAIVDKPIQPQPETASQKAPGEFTIDMLFFRNNSFQNPVTTYPLKLTLGEWLNVALNLVAIEPNLKLVIPSCTATPTNNPEDETKYHLFFDKCPNDPTLAFFPQNASSFGYRYQTFKFTTSDSVYIHCKAIVCKTTEKDWECDRTCNKTAVSNTGRRKRSDPRIIYIVSSPPFFFYHKHMPGDNEIIREWDIPFKGPTSSGRTLTTTSPTAKTPKQSPKTTKKPQTVQSTEKVTVFNAKSTAIPATTRKSETETDSSQAGTKVHPGAKSTAIPATTRKRETETDLSQAGTKVPPGPPVDETKEDDNTGGVEQIIVDEFGIGSRGHSLHSAILTVALVFVIWLLS